MTNLTVGELRHALAAFNDNDVLHLPGDLSFYQIKRRGENVAVLEVGEPLADLTPIPLKVVNLPVLL